MNIRKLLRPRNRWIRILVGVLLISLFCIQCTQRTEAVPETDMVQAVDGEALGRMNQDTLKKVEHLARTDHIALLEYCLEQYEGRFNDYTCTFMKQEKIGGTMKDRQQMEVKFMESPYSVAMKWVENAPIVDRTIYVEGQWDGRMLVRPANPALRLMVASKLVEPDGPDAMKNTLRPVNRFGFKRSLESLLRVYREAEEAGDLEESYGGMKEVNGRNAVVLVRYLPNKGDYPAHRTLTYIDLEYLVPIGVEGYGWDDQLMCRYFYKDVKFNVGLTSEDFLPKANDVQAP